MYRKIYCSGILILAVITLASSQNILEQRLNIGSAISDTVENYSLRLSSDQKILKVSEVPTAYRNDKIVATPGMLLYNTTEAKLQGYIPADTLTEPTDTYPYANGSSNVFAFTVITYTPTVDGTLTSMDIGIGSTNRNPPHRLIISTTKPCGGGSAIAFQKSNGTAYTEYVSLMPNTVNRYPMASPYSITAGTKYYIYTDASTNSAGPRILWSDTGVQNIPTIGYINTAGLCSENTGDVDAKFHITLDPAQWVDLND